MICTLSCVYFVSERRSIVGYATEWTDKHGARRMQSNMFELLNRSPCSQRNMVQGECNQTCLNCWTAAHVLKETWCKANAIKHVWITEPQPMFSKKHGARRMQSNMFELLNRSPCSQRNMVQGECNQTCLNCWTAAHVLKEKKDTCDSVQSIYQNFRILKSIL